MRVFCLLQGPDVGEQLEVLSLESGDVTAAGEEYVSLAARIEALKKWSAAQQ
jgi:hypothetical protein